MNVDPSVLYQIIGQQQVELALLRGRVAELEEMLRRMTETEPPPESAAPADEGE